VRILRFGVLLVLLLQAAPFRVTSRAAECGGGSSHCCASFADSHSVETQPASARVIEHGACGGCCGGDSARGDVRDVRDGGSYPKELFQEDSLTGADVPCKCGRGESTPVDEPAALPVSGPIRAVAPDAFWENRSRISPALCHGSRGRHAAGEERILAQWRETVGAVSVAGWGRGESVAVLFCSFLV